MSNLHEQVFQTARDAQSAASDAAFEAETARRILRRLCPGMNLPAYARELPQGRLNLAVIRAIVHDFPVKLVGHRVLWLHKVAVSELLGGDFFRTPIFREYSTQAARAGVDPVKEAFGLVSPWPQATAVVLHNWPHQDETVDRHQAHGRFVFVSSKFGSPIMYMIEPLNSFIENIAKAGYVRPHAV